jgi:hypothetical protein
MKEEFSWTVLANIFYGDMPYFVYARGDWQRTIIQANCNTSYDLRVPHWVSLEI